MAHPENGAPNLFGSVASCEPGHATQPDSMGNDEIDLRIGQLPQPSGEFWNRWIEIRLELIAAAAVQAVAATRSPHGLSHPIHTFINSSRLRDPHQSYRSASIGERKRNPVLLLKEHALRFSDS